MFIYWWKWVKSSEFNNIFSVQLLYTLPLKYNSRRQMDHHHLRSVTTSESLPLNLALYTEWPAVLVPYRQLYTLE